VKPNVVIFIPIFIKIRKFAQSLIAQTERERRTEKETSRKHELSFVCLFYLNVKTYTKITNRRFYMA